MLLSDVCEFLLALTRKGLLTTGKIFCMLHQTLLHLGELLRMQSVSVGEHLRERITLLAHHLRCFFDHHRKFVLLAFQLALQVRDSYQSILQRRWPRLLEVLSAQCFKWMRQYVHGDTTRATGSDSNTALAF